MMTVGTKSVENERAVTSQHWHRPAAGKDVRGRGEAALFASSHLPFLLGSTATGWGPGSCHCWFCLDFWHFTIFFPLI